MPNTLYAQQWLDALADLEKLLADDKLVQEGPLIEEREVAIELVLKLYFRYRRMVQRLTTSHDQIVQPQIRELLGKQLDYTIARMLECRQELVNLTFLECPWPNDLLLDLKLTPDDIELTAPAYNAAARGVEFERRRRVVEEANKPIEDDSASEVSSLQTYASEAEESRATGFRSRRQKERAPSVQVTIAPKETPEQKAARELREAKEKIHRDAVTTIQSHERARVARRVAKEAIRIREFRARMASADMTMRKVDPLEQDRAARVIQRCWRRYHARLRYERRNERLEEMLGLTMPSWTSQKREELGRAAFCERLEEQLAAEKKRDERIKEERKKMWETRGPALVEDIRDEIREWFMLWFNEVGYFDSIPAPQDGGSIKIATGQVRTPAEYLAAPPEDKKKKKKDDGGGLEEEEEEEEEEPEGWKMSESRAFPFLGEALAEFDEHWSRRTEQILDPRAPLILDMLTEPLYHELQLEMRRLADEPMREELEQWNKALVADGIENKTPHVPPKPEVFEKPPAEPAAKERADPLAEVPEDDLLLVLTREQVLRECPTERLSDWPGAVSYAIRADLQPCLGDVMQQVLDYCVLPMGSKRVSELAPAVKSVCICGPPGCGQLFLARAVCAELKATVFDLTPDRHVGRYTLHRQQEFLVHSVIKLSRAYAPSVILVEDESAFLKRIPPEMRRVLPKRFATIYRKILKGILPGDQVLFLTASQQPYMASRAFVKLHDKFIVIPVADYGSLYRIYKNTLMTRPAVDRHIDVSSLARIGIGQMPLDLARKALDNATGIRRRMEFRRKPLRPEEILERVYELGVPKKEIDSFAKFKSKLPLEVLRQEFELEQAEQAQDKKKKKK